MLIRDATLDGWFRWLRGPAHHVPPSL